MDDFPWVCIGTLRPVGIHELADKTPDPAYVVHQSKRYLKKVCRRTDIIITEALVEMYSIQSQV